MLLDQTNTKVCGKCRQGLPTTAFWKNRSQPDGLQRRCIGCIKQDRLDNVEKHRARQRACYHRYVDVRRQEARDYYVENKARMNAQAQRWVERNREKSRAIKRRWREKNADKNRQIANASFHKHYEKNRERILANAKAGRARKKNAIVRDLTAAQWRDILQTFNQHCAYCQQPFTDAHPATQDHMWPLVAGGGHTASNVVPAHRSCNSRKQRRNLLLFARVCTAQTFDPTHFPG